jgi:putative ABC transport system permease protein
MRKLRALWFRLLAVFNQQRQERELAEELEGHLQLHIDDNLRAGMNPQQARREALLKLGGVELVKETYRDRRGLPWLATLWQDLRYAARILHKDKVFTTVSVLTLALGIGANTAIFSLIDAVLLKSLPVSHPEELLQVTMDSGISRDEFSNLIWERLRDMQDVFSGLFAYSPGQRFNLTLGGEARYADGTWVSGDFFSALGVHSALGRVLNQVDDHRGCAGAAVLSYSFWRSEYGGSPDILDKTISLDFHRFPIVGVAEPGFFGVEVGHSAEVFAPLCAEAITRGANSFLDERDSWPLRAIGRPKPGISRQQVRARLRLLTPGILDAAMSHEQRPYAKPLDARPAANGLALRNGRNDFRVEYRPALLTLMSLVSIVLLIACANVANLLLARAAGRQREFGVRLALGAGRGRLIRQLLTESALLSTSGAVLGVLLAQLASRLLMRLLSSTSATVFLDLDIDGRVLAFTIATTAATGLFFGLAPAWRSARLQPSSAMKATGRGGVEGYSRLSFGKALVIGQIALSLILLVGAGLLLRTLRSLITLDPGFRRDDVLLAGVDLSNGHYRTEERPMAFREILQRVRALPGVRTASYAAFTPITPFFSGYTIVADGQKTEPTGLFVNEVSDGYFETLGTPILAGRDFNGQDTPTAAKVAIVNQAMATKFFGDLNPVGRHYRIQDHAEGAKLSEPIEIVGVVRDSKFNTLREQIEPMIFAPLSQEREPEQFQTLALRCARPPTQLIPDVKQVMASIDRGVLLDFTTLSEQVDASLTRERLLATLSGFFGGLALLLAAVGLYGVISYSVARRRNEIGIRVALGAEQARIERLVLGEVAALVMAGLGLGICGSLAVSRLIASLLYGVEPTDPAALGLSAALLMAVAAFAGYVPARRASRLNPMTALREE